MSGVKCLTSQPHILNLKSYLNEDKENNPPHLIIYLPMKKINFR